MSRNVSVFAGGILGVLVTFLTIGAFRGDSPPSRGPCPGSLVTRNNTVAPFNPDTLTAGVPLSGLFWSAQVTHAAGTATASTLLVRGSAIAGNGLPSPFGRILVGGAFIANIPGGPDTLAPILASQRNFVASIPSGLSCLAFSAQALTIGSGSIRLSDAMDAVVGP